MISTSGNSRPAPARLHFSLAPEPSRLLRARERIRDYLTLNGADQTAINDVVLAIEEAFTNAIRHSGSHDDIDVRLGVKDGALRAVVADKGRGFALESFDASRVPDPSQDHGRGLYLISKLCDELHLHCEGGVTVEMVKGQLAGLNEPAAAPGTGLTDHEGDYWSLRERLLRDEMDEAFASLDWEYRFTYANKAAFKFFAMSPDGYGRSFWEVFPATREMAVGRAIRRAMELGVSAIEEYVSPLKGRWVECRVYPAGSGVSLYLRDIDERKRKELERDNLFAALRESQIKLEAALVAITDGFYTLDREWQVTYLNDKAAEVFPGGKEALGANFWELFPDDVGSAFAVSKRTVMEQGEVGSFEFYYPPFDTWFEERDYPSADGITVVFSDVTERKRTAEALQASEGKYRAIVETSTEGIVISSPTGIIEFANQRMAEMVGYTAEELVGRPGAAMTSGDRESQTGGPRAELHASGEVRREIKLRCKDGSELWSLYSAAPMLDTDGRHIGNLAMHTDITGRKRAEEDRQRLLVDSQARTEELQGQSEELHAQAHELQAQREKLRAQAEVLLSQRDATARELESTSLLLEAAEALATTTTLPDVLARLAQVALRLSGHSRVTISAWHEDLRQMEVLLSAGAEPAATGFTISFDVMSAAARKAVGEGKPVLIDYDELEPGRRGLGDQVSSHCILHVPLFKQGHLTGFLAVDDPGQRREFSEREIELIEGIAGHAGVAIENAQLFDDAIAAREAAGLQARRMAVLKEIAEIGASSLEEKTVAQRFADAMPELLDARLVAVIVADEAGSRLDMLGTFGYSAELLAKLNPIPAEASAKRTYETGQSTYIGDYEVDNVVEAPRSLAREAGVRSSALLPLSTGAATIGVVAVFWTRPRSFSADEVSFLESVASEMAVGLQNVRLFEAERRAQQQAARDLGTTQLLLEAAGTLSRWTDLDVLLSGLANIVLHATGHTRAFVSLLAEDRAKATVVTTVGKDPLPARTVLAWNQLSPVLQAVLTDGRRRIVDLSQLPKERHRIADSLDSRLTLHVPIAFGDRVLGHVAIDDPGERREFSDREIRLVEGIASQAAVAIENARLLEAKHDELSRTALLREVAAAAAGSIDHRELSAQVLDACRLRLGAKAGNVYVIDRKAGVLRASALFGFPAALMPQLERMELDEARASARAYLKNEVVAHDSPDLPSGISERAKAAEATQDRWVSLPIRVRDEVVGSLGLVFPGQRTFGAEEVSLYQALADQLGVGLDKARLFEAEATARQKAAQELATTGFLLEAAAELNKRSDLGGTLSALADIALRATPHARVSIGLLAADRSQVTFAATAGKEPMPAGTVVSWNGVSSALREALIEGTTRVADYDLLSEEQRGNAVPVTSRLALLVPLVFDDRTVGHIGLDDREERREFTEREIEIIESIASHAATAIENARLFEEQQRIATTLQENLLHPVPQIPGLEVATCSLPANSAELVGGDFSDVFVADERNVVVLIGDVAGKGVRAAGLTETVRSTVRALAAVDPAPAFVLAKTNELLLRYDSDEAHVTAFLAVLDPQTGHLNYASAGHPAPIHLGAATCRTLQVAFGPPLGSFEEPYAEDHAMLAVDDYLVLYTDGVTEARREGELLGEKRLLEIVSGLRGRSAQEVADGVRDAALAFAGQLRDDLQVVVLRLD